MLDAAGVVDHLFGEFDQNFVKVVAVLGGVVEVADVEVLLVLVPDDGDGVSLERRWNRFFAVLWRSMTIRFY